MLLLHVMWLWTALCQVQKKLAQRQGQHDALGQTVRQLLLMGLDALPVQQQRQNALVWTDAQLHLPMWMLAPEMQQQGMTVLQL